MGSLEKRISKLEEHAKGNAIETFEELHDEARQEQEAFERGVPYTPRPFSDEVVRTFKEILSDPELAPELADAIRGALAERGHL